MHIPKTLLEAIRYYSDEQVCIDTVAEMRWHEGKPTCPKCGVMEGERRHYWLAAQKRWKCYACRKQFSVKVDTVFEDSPLGLDKWLVALWMLCNCKNGVSSHEISRELGIAQQHAWHMLHRLRVALQLPDGEKLGGVVEADECFLGGKVKNMHRSKRAMLGGKKIGTKGKAVVVGMVERGGRVRAQVTVERSQAVLHPIIAANVAKDATLVTDEWGGYVGSAPIHEVINHAVEYVNGHVHTNSIENFWSLLRRALGGTYVSVEPIHLQAYIHEQVYRFNFRSRKDEKITNADRFALALSNVAGKRLTWTMLTGKEDGSEVPF
ncbi:MAG: IS1595 family transposase [Terracidiphilus sp.]|jgi:transposase-like protein